MIDWLTVRVPYTESKPLNGGRIIAIGPEGEIEWESRRRITVEGSHSATVQVRAIGPRQLWISGNPSKFLQGLNVFGSNEFRTLRVIFVRAVVQALDLTISPANERQ